MLEILNTDGVVTTYSQPVDYITDKVMVAIQQNPVFYEPIPMENTEVDASRLLGGRT